MKNSLCPLLDIFNFKIYFSPYAESGKRYHLKPFLTIPTRSVLYWTITGAYSFKKSTLKIISWYQKQTHNGHLDIWSSFLTSSASLPPGFSLDLSNFLFSSLTFLCHFFWALHMLRKPSRLHVSSYQSLLHIPQKANCLSIATTTFQNFFSPILIKTSYLFSLTRVSHLR